MKISPDSKRRAGIRASGTVETLLYLVGACCLISAGLSWFQEDRESRWTESRLIGLAEEMVTVTENARIAGVELTVPGNLQATIDRIAIGAIAPPGEFQGQFFGLSGLSDEAREKVAEHLEFKFDRLSVVRLEAFASSH